MNSLFPHLLSFLWKFPQYHLGPQSFLTVTLASASFSMHVHLQTLFIGCEQKCPHTIPHSWWMDQQVLHLF
jgi:hypothetical protein